MRHLLICFHAPCLGSIEKLFLDGGTSDGHAQGNAYTTGTKTDRGLSLD